MKKQKAATIMDLHARLITLKLLPRTGWLQRGVNNVESIAEHTFSVASLALIIGDQIDGLDRGRFLAIALLHDMAEALVGDLPFSARRLIGPAIKQEAERLGMIELLEGIPQAEEYMQLWQEYTEGKTAEARLVKQLDRIEMLSQALAYEKAGSRVMGEFWEDIEEGWSDEFPIIQHIVEHLKKERARLSGKSLQQNYVNGHHYNGNYTNGNCTNGKITNGKIVVE